MVKNSFGAGDSMVAGLIYAILNNETPEAMLRWGIACRVAATMSAGTDLAHQINITHVFKILF